MKKIEESGAIIKNLETQGYRDPLYWESGDYKRKVYILMNAHFSDFEADKSLQNHVVYLMGKDEIGHSVDGRAKFIHGFAQKAGTE